MSKLADLLKSAKSKFAIFLSDNKIDPARVLIHSHAVESLRSEDRAIRRAKGAARGKDDETAKTARARKPRSGRPVTDRLVRAAIAGQKLSGPAKHRLVRAVNAVRAVKKQAETDLRTLF